MGRGCRHCAEGLEHCHGTLVHHAWRRSECTEDGCVTVEVAHTFSIDCAAVGCDCAQLERLHAAS
ncbi:hypothetical protein LV457_11980 [Mycobacterium sp. MYCO198283]|uniref:hypothetical protein n=1 Tax=Mycobacterium sp. MYCO198283 TaxID=2883505 RepID=UPI001E5E7661|nr:hypothetical protein [Mycobacterium sp. MYCO198283]MCG5433000.1 hypothetical protein [Mycobacterium sp. MYCO198283]